MDSHGSRITPPVVFKTDGMGQELEQENQLGGHCDNPGEMIVVGKDSRRGRGKKWLDSEC